jgi:hypothetical protein
MNNKKDIKTFVINKLGCNCPSEVFNIIERQKDIQLDQNINLNYKINIGNRLLIYIIEINDKEFLRQNLLTIVARGIDERNKNNFNRFRLVIISNDIDEIDKSSQRLFDTILKGDQKAHLHIVREKDFVI